VHNVVICREDRFFLGNRQREGEVNLSPETAGDFAKMFEIQIFIAIFAAHFEGASPEKWAQIIIKQLITNKNA